MSNFKHKKKFGQNFLKDEKIIKDIVNRTSLSTNDLVLEVGPGKGVLTKELSNRAKQVLAFEVDETLGLDLKLNLMNCENIEIIFKDFLEVNLNEVVNNYKYDKLFFVANLPYYITTPIIMKLIESALPFSEIVIMVQKEVGERLVSKPGSKAYGSLSVFLDYYFEREYLFDVNRDKFYPSPNVDSCIVKLKRRVEKIEVNNEEQFFNLIKKAFQFKRKNLKNNLKDYDLDLILKILSKYNLDLSVRAEQLSTLIFADISNNLK